MLTHYTSDPKFIKRFWSHVVKSRDGCWEWVGTITSYGYGLTSRKPTHKNIMAHRASWAMAYGPIPDGLCICHHCDNRACVRPDHLFVGTKADNTHDMYDKGRNAPMPLLRGEEIAISKLTSVEVRAMRRDRDNGALLKDLAHSYGISLSQAGKVCNRDAWRHVM